jgi:hypothetical protein
MLPVGEGLDGGQAPPKLQKRIDVGVEEMEGDPTAPTHSLQDSDRTLAAADVNQQGSVQGSKFQVQGSK